MRRIVFPIVALVLVLVVIRGLSSWPVPEPVAETVDEVPSVRLRRDGRPLRGVARKVAPREPSGLPAIGAPDGVPDRPPLEAEQSRRPELSELSPEEQDRILRDAGVAIATIRTVCAEVTPAAGFDVMAELTLDGRGLLEAELSTFDQNDQGWVTAPVLDDVLVSCLDDEVWNAGWPEVDGGVELLLAWKLDPDD